MAVPVSFLGVVAIVLLLLGWEGGRGGPVVMVRAGRESTAWKAQRQRCTETVSSWAEEQLRELESRPPEESERMKLRDLLFFLHIPRTGGRTFHECFLKHLIASDQRCPRSYDKLRIDRRQPGCHVIATHDDYSLLDNLPFETTSVVTSIREPVDRVLSAYEFSIEVAARALRRPAAKRAPSNPLEKWTKANNIPARKSARVSQSMRTIDIWPWKYLVPAMEGDLVARRKARLDVASNVSALSVEDSYDAPIVAMPFLEFIQSPMADELVHNGATFQVAGLTNTSYSAIAGAIRRCVIQFPRLGEPVLEVAKRRLDRMLHVGLTERQDESVMFFAKVLEGQVSMEVFMRSLLNQATSRRSRKSALLIPKKVLANFTSLDAFTSEEILEEMLGSYRDCVADLRVAQVDRRSISLASVKPIEFSRERRKFIPDNVMEKLANLNILDSNLYAHAQFLFQQQQKMFGFESYLDTKDPETWSKDGSDGLREDLEVKLQQNDRLENRQTVWTLTALWALMVVLVSVTVICLVTKHRSRVKEV